MIPFWFWANRPHWNYGVWYNPFHWDKEMKLNLLKTPKSYLEFLLSQIDKRIKELENAES